MISAVNAVPRCDCADSSALVTASTVAVRRAAPSAGSRRRRRSAPAGRRSRAPRRRTAARGTATAASSRSAPPRGRVIWSPWKRLNARLKSPTTDDGRSPGRADRSAEAPSARRRAVAVGIRRDDAPRSRRLTRPCRAPPEGEQARAPSDHAHCARPRTTRRELAVGARVLAQQLERRALVDRVALHQDALGALDHRAALERASRAGRPSRPAARSRGSGAARPRSRPGPPPASVDST